MKRERRLWWWRCWFVFGSSAVRICWDTTILTQGFQWFSSDSRDKCKELHQDMFLPHILIHYSRSSRHWALQSLGCSAFRRGANRTDRIIRQARRRRRYTQKQNILHLLTACSLFNGWMLVSAADATWHGRWFCESGWDLKVKENFEKYPVYSGSLRPETWPSFR